MGGALVRGKAFPLLLLVGLASVTSAGRTHSSTVMPGNSRLMAHKPSLITSSAKASTTNQKGPLQDGPSQSEILNAVALVTGTTVGAGVLALPATTAAAGFVPSTAALVGAWVFMCSTGLLFAEIAANLRKEEGMKTQSLGILAMTDKLLGKAGAIPAGSAYMLIHYALLVAYIAGAGAIVSDVLHLPKAAGPVLFTAVVGSVLSFGSNALIDQFNNAWVAAVVISFSALIVLAVPAVNVANLSHADYSAVSSSIPTMLVALVFHNVVPTVCQQLKYDRKAVTTAVVAGSAIPLVMFLIWNAVVLGIAPAGDPLASLRSGSGGQTFSVLVNTFSVSAIITSFTGFVIGLLGFFQDLSPSPTTSITTTGKAKNAAPQAADSTAKASLQLYAAVLLPPMAIAIAGGGDIFNKAIDIAGLYGITVLFGILPVVMAWLQRSSAGRRGDHDDFLPGGQLALGTLLISVILVVAKAVGAL